MWNHQIPATRISRGRRWITGAALFLLGPSVLLLARAGDATRAQEEAVVAVSPEFSLAASGTRFAVDIVIRDAVSLGAFQFTLAYPPDLVAYDGFEIGPFLGSTGRPVTTFPPIVQSDRVTLVAASQRGAPGPSGSGTLATLHFQAVGAGSGWLALSEVLVSDSENGNRTRPGTADGQVAIDATAAATATPEPTPTPKGFRVRLPIALHGIAMSALPTAPTAPPPTVTPVPPTASPTRTRPPAPTATLSPTPSATPTTSPTPSKADPKIGELRCDTTDEVVSIVNQGGEAMDLLDWQMFSTQGIQTYRFRESYILEPGASVYLHSGSRAAPTNGNHIRWSEGFIWNEIDGDTAQLKTPRPELIIVDSRDCPPR
jgi:hypothetical protein